ncbi:MAG: 2,3-bisphosphoglycerate-independent phosphoglycerate mutase [Candidatus Omnitrophota bacterium]
MKYLLIAASGAADIPDENAGGKTPLEMAKIPHLHFFAKIGKIGLAKLASGRTEPWADVTLMNLLGYDADREYTGRGPLEAANMELKLEDNEIPFRMNFITEADGTLADPEAGHIASKEARALINFLNKKVANDFTRFFPGSDYRHIVVFKDSHGYDALSARTFCPHDIIGDPIETRLPKGPGGELLKKIMFDAKLLLQDHEINQVRVDLGENPANMIWVWGQGPKPQLKKFSEKQGVSGAMISDSEYANGLARLIGLTVHESRKQNEDLSVRYEEKAKIALEALQEKDFVCLHLKDSDEASRRGDLRAKVSALEALDFFILSKIRAELEKKQDLRILVSTCHVMPYRTRRRTKEPTPFVLAGARVAADASEAFSEIAAKAVEYKVNRSEELIQLLLAR